MDTIRALKAKQDFSPFIKLALEVGPLCIFFVTNSVVFKNDPNRIFYATATFMVATTISLLASRIFLKRIPILALVTGFFVMIFGALTIYLQDDFFIKIKPTVVNTLFASTLAAGLYFKRNVLKLALGEVMQLQEEGWRLLTMRWAAFFVTLAILNEIVWRNFTADTWVQFKSLGVMPLTAIFMISQIGLIMKYQIPEHADKTPEAS